MGGASPCAALALVVAAWLFFLLLAVAPTPAGIRGQRRDTGLSVVEVGTIDGGGSGRSLSTFLPCSSAVFIGVGVDEDAIRASRRAAADGCGCPSVQQAAADGLCLRASGGPGRLGLRGPGSASEAPGERRSGRLGELCPASGGRRLRTAQCLSEQLMGASGWLGSGRLGLTRIEV